MNIVKTPSQFNIRDTYFTDSLYNATNSSGFIRIVMCESAMNSAGLHLRLQLSDTIMRRRFHSHASIMQYCTEYNTEKNFACIASIQQIERDILNLYQRTFKPVNKTPCSHIFETLLCGKLKICANVGVPAATATATATAAATATATATAGMHETDDDSYNYTHDCENTHAAECDSKWQHQPYQQQQPTAIVLKISGVWESETTFGLTFKFITLMPLLPLISI